MKASICSMATYAGRRGAGAVGGGWPVAPANYESEVGQRSFQQAVEQLQLADQLGFDWISFSEHHYSGGSLTPSPVLFATYLASRTTQARIAMLGPLVPIQNPVRVAEELAMLDNLSGGRLVVGFLRGTPNEFEVYNINPSETQDRLFEGIELMLKAWTEPQPFGWEGRYFQYRTVSVWPRPVQQPHPPIYVIGTSFRTVEYAAAHRFGIGMAMDRYNVLAPAINRYRDLRAQASQPATESEIIYRGQIYVAETEEDAEAYRVHLQGRRGGPMATSVTDELARLDPHPRNPAAGYGSEELRPRVNFCGTPDMIIDQIKECHAQTGAGVVDLLFGAPPVDPLIDGTEGVGYQSHRSIMHSIELFGREILPAVREL